MDSKKIYITQPQMPSIERYQDLLKEIWSNKILTNSGPFHKQLEHALCEFLRVKHISLFSNATVGLMAALEVLDIKREVITTPYSFVATSNSILWNKCKPVFVDIDQHTLNIAPEEIEKAITDQTDAIMPVHCYGNPCDVERIKKISEQYNLKIIYDAAHAFGVEYKGESLLNWGDLSILSFHATKVFNTFEGGAVITNSDDLKKRIDIIRNFGIENEVTVSSLGMNGKMNEVSAAFGLLQLEDVENNIRIRKEVDTQYRAELGGILGIRLYNYSPYSINNYSYFPLRVTADYHMTRDALYNKLRDRNIFSRRYFYPLITDFDYYKNNPATRVHDIVEASKAASEILCLPIYPGLSKEDITLINNLIRI